MYLVGPVTLKPPERGAQSFISIMDVPLTTVAQPIHEMGKRAFDILLNTPFNSDSADRVMLSLQPELIVRSSTARQVSKI